MKTLVLCFTLCICLGLTACGEGKGQTVEPYYNNSSEPESTVTENDDSYNNFPSDDTYIENEPQSSYEHYCEADGCTNEGTKSCLGISGETEWYCQEHYDEMMDIINMMEEDVGAGSASKHTCEACSKEGTHSIIGLSGETEYYCTEHYNEMVEILSMMLGE